jgi:Ca-activated chloride channel family protein
VKTAHAWQFNWLGVPVRLLHPQALWWGVAALVAVTLYTFGALRRRRQLAHLLGPAARARVIDGERGFRGPLATSALGLGMLCLSAALSQPQCGTRTELTRRTGIDVVVALDVSRSMQAQDIRPSRLERAKLELADLMDRLRGDRIGIVVFAADAFVQCPLTTDYAAAKLFLKAINYDSVPQQGTSLASALMLGKQLLDEGGGLARGRALVLLTDGEDHEPGLDNALDALSQDGIRVYPVGIGSASGEPIPILDDRGRFVGYKKDRQGQTVMTRLNEDVLREVAEKTGGRYFHSTAGDVGIPAVAEELDRLDKQEFESRLTVEYAERYRELAGPGFALLLLGAALPQRGRRREAA